MADDIEKFAFSVEEAARRAGVGRDAVYKAIRDGRLAAKKFGRRTLITAEALREFLAGLPALELKAGNACAEVSEPGRRPGSGHRGCR